MLDVHGCKATSILMPHDGTRLESICKSIHQQLPIHVQIWSYACIQMTMICSLRKPKSGLKINSDGSSGLVLFYLVIELPDVLLDVREQTSKSELLNELPDVFMVIQGQTGSVAPQPHSPSLRALGLTHSSVQAAQTTQGIQFEGTALHAAAGSIWKKSHSNLLTPVIFPYR